jgi:5-methyltetrahydropteroyltriglutamate--homocysteine methyltransferase
LFRGIRAERLLLEYDDDRSGSFEPLGDVADDKFVVLGLVTTKKPALESVESLTRRIADAARFVSMDRLGLSPQCGFASSIVGNRIAPLDQRRKLELVGQAVDAIWPRR